MPFNQNKGRNKTTDLCYPILFKGTANTQVECCCAVIFKGRINNGTVT